MPTSTQTPITKAQRVIRELSPKYLKAFGKEEAVTESSPTGPMAVPLDSTNLSALAKAPNQHPTRDGRETPNANGCGGLIGEKRQASPGAQLPSTLAELSKALRNPLPPVPPKPPCKDYLEALANWKPWTMDDYRELFAREREARDAILKEYTERTGQQVDYCDDCDLGIAEEEVEAGWQVVVETYPCENCNGLGVVAI